MPSIIIRVTEVTSGDPNVPVAFFAADAASIVRFETTPGLNEKRFFSALLHLWDSAINVDYEPQTGSGTFLLLDADPDVASYSVEEIESGGESGFLSVPQEGWDFLPEEIFPGRFTALTPPGWLQLHELASIEGELMVIAAIKRLSEGLNDACKRKMYVTAARYVDFMHENINILSPVANLLARDIQRLGISISEHDWNLSVHEMAYIYRETY